MRRWQKALGYVHGSADPLQHLVDGRRALAGLLAYGYHRPCSAFPDRKIQWLPARAGAGLPDSQWRGPHRHHTGFPFTKAWRQ
ncbi:hypothetical protein TPA0905_37920 [Streptomyces olivaceus]|nr:hypothetical protein TPA0905_37920 [Streptomyces olivaceus]